MRWGLLEVMRYAEHAHSIPNRKIPQRKTRWGCGKITIQTAPIIPQRATVLGYTKDAIGMEQIAIRLRGSVYLLRVGAGDTLRLWVSKQSLIPLSATNHTVLMLGQADYEPYTACDFTRVPILCDSTIHSAICSETPIAKLTYKPTQFTIPLYPSSEWLDYLHAHTPIIIHHNERYWLFTEYDADSVYLYRKLGAKWDTVFRCWVFTNLPSASHFQNAPICPLSSLLSPVGRQTGIPNTPHHENAPRNEI
jgi:hypothetical protein